MRFTKLVSPSLTELFVKEIAQRILSGAMSVGERLPNERELARMMKVSRAVINGGMSQLARMGFVDVVPRQGIFVADYTEKGTLDSLQTILEYNGGRFDPIMMDSIYEMRNCEESHIAVLAAMRRTDRDIADLRALIEALEDSDDLETLVEKTFKFYQLLAKASGNVLYPMLLYSRKAIYAPLLRIVYVHSHKESRLGRMRRLVDLIEEGRGEDAAECIRETSRWSREILNKQHPPERTRSQDNVLNPASPPPEKSAIGPDVL